jgi:hypothetical protein
MLAGGKAIAVSTLPRVKLPAPRARGRSAIGTSRHGAIQVLSAADIVELKNKAKENTRSRIDFESFTPVIACMLWILGGTIFYATHDKFGWVSKPIFTVFLPVTFTIRL